MGISFFDQIERLTNGGFRAPKMLMMWETLLKELRSQKPVKESEETGRKKWTVVSYMNGVSYKRKTLASRGGVTVALSAPNKLSGLAAEQMRKKITLPQEARAVIRRLFIGA